MGSYREAPSQILLRYANLGIKAASKAPRIGLQIDGVAALNRPYRFIYRFSSKRRPPAELVPQETHPEDLRKISAVQRDKRIYQLKNKKNVAPDAIAQHVGEQSAHLSDVVEVITADDPTFAPEPAPLPPVSMQAPEPYVYIVEQPAPKSLRFRYECEGRSAGSIPGINSTPENRTFPAIKVCGYRGCMVIVVSCVTKDEPYKPHPHNLVGRDCQMGVCTVKVRTEGDADSCQVQFRNLGIQCVKRRDIAEALRVRQELRVNPFKTGYGHKNQPQSIDLNAVRLCFQVFLTDDSFKVERALQPVVSDTVYDKKAMSELLIVRSSHCSGPARGGTTVILLCEKVTREDTEIWFFREENGATVWSERVSPEFVHKQLAVVFKTPPYCERSTHVTVQFQLHRLSDNAKSNVYSFEYIPDSQDIVHILGSKRPKKQPYNLPDYIDSTFEVKAEPRDRTPPHPTSNTGYQWRSEGAGPSWCPPQSEHYFIPQNQQALPMHQMQMPMQSHMGQSLSPMGQSLSPMAQNMGGMQQSMPMGRSISPMMPLVQGLSPAQQCMSPVSQCMSPGHGAMSPGMAQAMSPGMAQAMSPGMAQAMSPGMPQGMSPGMQPMGNMQPMGMGMHLTDMDAHQPLYNQEILPIPEEPTFNSGDLSMYVDRGADLSDSLNRLSTKDLLQP